MSDKTSSSKSGGISHGDGATNTVSITGGARDVFISKSAPPSPPPPRQLRKPLDDFVGREKEISQLINSLRNGGRASISGISGMGGIGKTELALLVAYQLSEDYPDVQLFLEMRGTAMAPLSSIEALSRCIRSLIGPEVVLPDPPEELAALYRSCLSGKRALILLDNAADRSQVLPLTPPAGCALLLTSRGAITLPGMERLSLEQLKPEEARSLLLEIAPRIAPEIADRIGYLCGYLPLAVRAAGSLLEATIDLDPAQYVAQLFDERTRLDGIGAEGVEIGVEASFNLGYERLEPEAARVFRQLSIFAESFDTEAEEIICRDPGHKALSDLVRRSLVVYEKEGRYLLHDLTRIFARGRLSGSEEETGGRAHAMHYQTVLATANNLYLKGGEGVGRGLSLFDKERVNIEAGWKWAQARFRTNDEGTARLCISYAEAGVYVLDLRQHPRERIEWAETMLAAARSLKRRDVEGRALGNLGNAYAARGEPRRAIEYFEQHLEIVRELGDCRGEGNILGNLGITYKNLGETQKAIEYYEQVSEIARKIGDRRGEGQTLGNLGNAYKALGETGKAIEYHKRDLEIAREIGDRRGEGQALGNLGIAYKNLGETGKAIEYQEQRLQIARELGDRRGEGNALGNLGVAYRILGETRKAIECQEQHLEIAREIGDRRGEAYSLHGKANALDSLGDRAQAIELLESALRIYEQIEDPWAGEARRLLSEWRGE